MPNNYVNSPLFLLRKKKTSYMFNWALRNDHDVDRNKPNSSQRTVTGIIYLPNIPTSLTQSSNCLFSNFLSWSLSQFTPNQRRYANEIAFCTHSQPRGHGLIVMTWEAHSIPCHNRSICARAKWNVGQNHRKWRLCVTRTHTHACSMKYMEIVLFGLNWHQIHFIATNLINIYRS